MGPPSTCTVGGCEPPMAEHRPTPLPHSPLGPWSHPGVIPATRRLCRCVKGSCSCYSPPTSKLTKAQLSHELSPNSTAQRHLSALQRHLLLHIPLQLQMTHAQWLVPPGLKVAPRCWLAVGGWRLAAGFGIRCGSIAGPGSALSRWHLALPRLYPNACLYE